jgi:hypothetical protein
MAEPLTVRIKADWDSALTYDSLDRAEGQAGPDEAVFVGRKDLLDPLVAAIRQPAQRGTYLISGYRGTGKTTLVIEALRRAQHQLVDGWRLFPLVLNVSEVSASLESAPAPRGGSGAQAGSSLKIDPRRLLVALLRALQRRSGLVGGVAPGSGKALQTMIREVYDKAVAREYSLSVKARSESSRAVVRETSLGLQAKDAYKILAGVSALGAGAFAAVAVLGPALQYVHGAALALAGVSAVSFAMSRKVMKKNSDAREAEESLKFDNSLHQLENDLRDILSRLYHQKLRTVVVLEELDKIRDEAGDQLDGVIRYFKNLFTQAPALFFFLTDKSYFDLISSKIKKARRQRSYAVEHTFFTHRVFVGRPTTRDCLEYLREVLLDPTLQQRVMDMYTTAEPKAKSLQDLDPFARFVRVLLFRAANHLFDLKNEMRHFVRAGATPDYEDVQLVIDDQSLPEDQAAVAVLQDRVEEKAGSFALASGRTYANEVLHDCLYAVFNELGSTRSQKIADFYPFPAEEPAQEKARASGAVTLDKAPAAGGVTRDRARQPELLLDEQLESNEVQRIQDAVRSLVEDLQRGGAFEAGKTDSAQGEFVWKQNAARAFRYVRKLEKHEEELVATLHRLSASVAAFKPGGTLGFLNTPQAGVLVDAMDQRAKDLQGADTPLPVERALEEADQQSFPVAQITADAFNQQLLRLGELFGIPMPMLVAPSSHGGGLFLIPTTWGDPRGSTIPRQGVVLLAQGDGERLDDDVREFVANCPGLERLSLIHVIHAPGQTSGLEDASRLAWVTRPGQALSLPAVTMKVLALDEGLAGRNVAGRWGELLGRELLFRASWAAQPRGVSQEAQVLPHDPVVQVRHTTGSGAQGHVVLSGAIQGWLQSSARLLWVTDPPSSHPVGLGPSILVALAQSQFRDVVVAVVRQASTLEDLYQNVGEDLWNRGGMLGGPPVIPNARAAAAKALVSAGVVLLVMSDDVGEPVRSALRDGGRGILLAKKLPTDLESLALGVTQLSA